MGHYSAVVRRHWSTDCICKSTNSSTPLFALHELNSYSDPLRQPNAPVEFAESGAISSFLRKYVLTFAPKEGRRYTARIGVKTRQLSHFATPTRRQPAEVGTNVSLAHLHKRVLAIPHRTPSRHIRSNVPRRNNVPPISSTLTRPAASDHGAGVALLHPVALPSAEIAALDCF